MRRISVGGMSRPPKPVATAKRVPPPAVPDAYGAPAAAAAQGSAPALPVSACAVSAAVQASVQHRHSGSSFGSSQGYASSEDAAFLQPPDTPGGNARDDHSDYGSTVSGVSGMSSNSGMSGKSPGVPPTAPAFTFPPPTQPLTHKAAVYYHHQLALQEDQGIDMTQSPGRDSPGSSSGSAGSCSRHSTASLDSGRASARGPSQQGVPGICCDHSLADTGRTMMCQGMQDQDIIHTWLGELRMEEYAGLFVTAGYDIPTMTRMTPEDLTAVGVKKPNHRKRLKAELANLNVPDNLPDFIPGSLDEWLRLLRLEEYGPALVSQGYRSVQDVTQLTWEDLEDIGIVRLGHQKKILLAIKRVKDIRSGKRTYSNPGCIDLRLTPHHPQDVNPSPLSANYNPVHVHASIHAYQQQWEVQQTRNISASYHIPHPKLHYVDDLVPIQVRQPRGKSLESLEDTERTTHLTFSPDAQTYYYPNGNQNQPSWRRSYDDGDITPTNEATILSNYEGGGTLPRPRGLVRPRPLAKISATTKPCVRENVIFQDINEKSPKYIMDAFHPAYQTDKLGYPLQQHMRPVYAVSPQLGKKMPPEPPKRQSSNPGIDQVTVQLEHMAMTRPFSPNFCYQYGPNFGQTTVEIHPEKQKNLPLSLPAYPSSDSLSVSLESAGLQLPPPPAPPSPSPPRYQTQISHDQHDMVGKLLMQNRNGSDASFKSSSSTESDSLPFANDNAGTIKQNRGQMSGRAHTVVDYGRSLSALPPRHPSAGQENKDGGQENVSAEPADVLDDIGNMLANLTDELDAMLEEEKRQGLTEG